VRAAQPSQPKALDALRSEVGSKQVWNGKRRFDIYGCNGVTVTDLLDAAAMASAGVLFGFNRGGGMNIVIMLEGDKETNTVYDAEEFAAIAAVAIDFLQLHAADKYPDISAELAAENTPEKG
jgi:hypothetical protein